MFKLRTLTICLKLRVVVTVLLDLVSSHHLSFSGTGIRRGSGSFQFPPALLTSFQAIWKMVLTWNEKKNITRNLHKEQKLHLASFFPVEKEKVVELRPVPLPASTPRHCYPLRNYTEYSTSRFVLLHLNCKTRGRGTEIRIYQVYTEYDSLWVHTEIRGNSWTAFFFCCGVCDSLTTTPLPPCLPNFHKSSLPPAVRVREVDKGVVLLNRSSSPPLVCLWWRRLCQEQCLLLLCCPGCGLLR